MSLLGPPHSMAAGSKKKHSEAERQKDHISEGPALEAASLLLHSIGQNTLVPGPLWMFKSLIKMA